MLLEQLLSEVAGAAERVEERDTLQAERKMR
jgi:hypothetical protein